jgi:transposase
MAIRYAVDLTDTERATLREIISKHKAKRRTILNASILLKADRTCGWTNENIASAYEVSTKKIEQLKKRFVEEGFEAALARKPVTNGHRRKITGDEEAHLIALCCSQAPEGHKRWTLRLLAETMVELDLVDAVSHETVRRTLKKMNLNGLPTASQKMDIGAACVQSLLKGTVRGDARKSVSPDGASPSCQPP